MPKIAQRHLALNALFNAIQTDNLESVENCLVLLGAACISVDERNKDGATPLMFAAECGSARSAQALMFCSSKHPRLINADASLPCFIEDKGPLAVGAGRTWGATPLKAADMAGRRGFLALKTAIENPSRIGVWEDAIKECDIKCDRVDRDLAPRM